MNDIYVDGNTKVAFCPSIANIHAPTTVELGAGTSLEDYVTPTGLQIKTTTANVDTSSLSSIDTTGGAGRRSYAISLECKRQSPVDIPFNLLPYKAAGYLVVRRSVAATTAWTTGQMVEVYPVVCGEPDIAPPAANEIEKFTSTMMTTSTSDTRAVIA